MPIPTPVLNPPFQVVRLNHVVLTVTDLPRARAFWGDTLGLQVTDEADGRIYFRAMEERGHHCIVLQQADAAAARVLGYKVYSEQDLDRAAAFCEARGLPVSWPEEPFQGRTLRTTDPQGIPLEFYFEMAKLPSVHQQYALYKGVKPLRIDHFNCFSDDVDASVGFYTDIGFRVTEYTENEDRTRLWAALDAPQGRRARHGVHARQRAAAAPCRLLGADAAQHHRPARPDGHHRLRRQHRARARPANRRDPATGRQRECAGSRTIGRPADWLFRARSRPVSLA